MQKFDEHYLKAITQMGDAHQVITNQAIFTSKKIKLVDKGVKVTSELFERLVCHKLIPEIDQCLTVENAESAASLKDYAANLLDTDPALSFFGADSEVRSGMLRAFDGLLLSAPMAFKLTVIRNQRPEIYDHSVRVALVTLYLALTNFSFSVKELAALTAAAIFHDIGILHIAPELLSPGRRLEKEERHHLYAHPITAFMILRETSDYDPEVSRVVLEHHERLDGSGYPRGLKDDEICLGAQILMLVEMASAVFERKQNSQQLSKFSVLLRLNQNKFHRELSQQFLALVHQMLKDQDHDEEEVMAFTASATLAGRLEEIARVFLDWKTTRLKCGAEKANVRSAIPVLSIIDARIADLQKMFLYAGFDVTNPESLISVIQDDLQVISEAGILLSEVRWQLLEIIHEAHRRLNASNAVTGEEHQLIQEWITRNEEVIRQI